MKSQGTQLSLFQTRSSGDAFAVRVSARARRLTARVHVGGRVEIVVPVGVKARAVRDFVQRFTPGSIAKWPPCSVSRSRPRAPTASTLPIPRSISRSSGTNARGARSSRVLGGLRCARRIPIRRAAAQGMAQASRADRLAPPLLALARDLNYSVERVVIRCQRTRWGSCSTRGTVSLNCSLVFLRPEVVSYLFVHELAHLKHMNHSAGFWRLVQTSSPITAGWTASCSRAGGRCRSGSSEVRP